MKGKNVFQFPAILKKKTEQRYCYTKKGRHARPILFRLNKLWPPKYSFQIKDQTWKMEMRKISLGTSGGYQSIIAIAEQKRF